MAGKERPSDRRTRSRRKATVRDDWLEQFAPAAGSGASGVPVGASSSVPDPSTRVAGAPPSRPVGAVPGSVGLDPELHSAALRELDLDTPVPPGSAPEPEGDEHGPTRDDLNDWLAEFAPVADAAEAEADDPDAGVTKVGATEAKSDSDGSDDDKTDGADDESGPQSKGDTAADKGDGDAEGPANGLSAPPPNPASRLELRSPDVIPGVISGFLPRRSRIRPVDWDAPLIWSNDDLPQPAAEAEAEPETEEPVDDEPDSPDLQAWPAPPELDERGVPIMEPIRQWSPSGPVAWGWAAAWPNGGPGEWHTQSLPVSVEPQAAELAPVAHEPVITPLPELPADAARASSFDAPAVTQVAVAPTPASPVVQPLESYQEPELPVGIIPGAGQLSQLSTAAGTSGEQPWNDVIAWQPPAEPLPEGLAPEAEAPEPEIEAADIEVAAPPPEWADSATIDEPAVAAVAEPAPVEDVTPEPIIESPPAPSEPEPEPEPEPAAVAESGSFIRPPEPPAEPAVPEVPVVESTPVAAAGGVPGTLPTMESVAAEADTKVDGFFPAEPVAAASTPTPAAELDSVLTGGPVEIGQSATPATPVADSNDAGLESGGFGAERSRVFSPTPEPTDDDFLGTPGTPSSPGEGWISPKSATAPARPQSRTQPTQDAAAGTGLYATLRANPATRLLLDWIPLLVGAFVVAMVVRAFVFQAYFIPSGSMIPTLEVRDRVLVNKLSYNFHDVNRGDIVVFKRPAGTSGEIDDLIKRVIGLPGETLTFTGGEVYVDGQLVQESYLLEQSSTLTLGAIPGCASDGAAQECTVPEDHVLVLGDNRNGSTDGRVFGPVPIDTIVGRAFIKVWPVSDIGRM